MHGLGADDVERVDVSDADNHSERPLKSSAGIRAQRPALENQFLLGHGYMKQDFSIDD